MHDGDGATVFPFFILVGPSFELLRSFQSPSGVLPEAISKVRGSSWRDPRILQLARPHLCGSGVDLLEAEPAGASTASTLVATLDLLRDSAVCLRHPRGLIQASKRGSTVNRGQASGRRSTPLDRPQIPGRVQVTGVDLKEATAKIVGCTMACTTPYGGRKTW